MDAASGTLENLFELQGVVLAVAADPAPDHALRLAVPNPFDRHTTIHFEMPRRVDVKLEIYDAGGRWVRTLVDGVLPPGRMRASAMVWTGPAI